MRHVLIAGYGMVGARLAEEIRRRDPRGRQVRLTVVGDEPAYNRILLPSVVAGQLDEEQLLTHDRGWAFRHRTDLRLGLRVDTVDPLARKAWLSDGQVLAYDDLVIATGSTARKLPGLDGGFRTLADCRRLRDRDGSVAVLGGGVLGVEVAVALAERGQDVTLVHPGDVLMDRQLDATAGAIVADVVSRLGVGVRLGQRANGWTDRGLRLEDGEVVAADSLVVTAGAIAETGLARSVGADVDAGVLVDDRLATSVPGVHAIGDCAQHTGAVSGFVQPGWEQAEVLADLLTGADLGARYLGTPAVARLKARGLDLVSVGSLDGDEELAFSDPRRGRYARVALDGDRVAGAVVLGLPDAGAAVTQHFVRGIPAPSDRLGLLLGRALPPESAAHGGPSRLPAEAEICRCNRVTKRQLVHAWQAGSRSVRQLAGATRATTGCGTCTDAVDGICSWLAAADSPDGAELAG
ncbi:FAD-dependent oxidoreductase [Fodinicola acaciae]|uniref:FAD-dependent oxidoreductase n=1 Tax=Fodinicola acaciae TaxID=2681555 RepID=UPI001C9E23BD|nr:FAD-dependent oxidoreductase [Fodinicola acaciae]